MRRKIIFSILVLFLSFSLSGCVPLIIGGAAGAVGCYAVSRDTVQGETDKPYEAIWSAGITVSRIRGTIKREDSLKGTIELSVGASKVWISLIRITDATTRLRVAARKHHLPDLELAQDMFVKIMEQAK